MSGDHDPLWSAVEALHNDGRTPFDQILYSAASQVLSFRRPGGHAYVNLWLGEEGDFEGNGGPGGVLPVVIWRMGQ